MPARISRDFKYNEINTSKQIGNIRSDVSETYRVYPGKKPVLESKNVDTYYVDEYTGKRATPIGKSSHYSYNEFGELKEAVIERQNNKLYNSITKYKIGNGSWFNKAIETNYLSVSADQNGAINNAVLRSRYLDKEMIEALPINIKKTVYAALDFLMANLKKIR